MRRARLLLAPLRRGRRAEWALAVFCILCLAGMLVFDPSLAPIPFHFIYTAVTIVYGLRLWQVRGAMVAAFATGLSTGGITLYNVVTANEPAPELMEVPLMTMMVVATVLHVRSRQRAEAVIAVVADERKQMIERERGFFANATHDLMTPLTIARGHLDVLTRRGQPTAIDIDNARTVVIDELHRMETLIGDLLLVGRLDAGSDMRRERLDAEDFLHGLLDRWTAVGDRIWTIDIDAPGILLADPETLGRAIGNVLENAVAYTVDGDTITIRARGDADRLQVEIADSGPGIAVDALPRIFDRFYRVAPALNGDSGSGLGLSISRDIVRAHGGTIAVTSEPGIGTRFTFDVPGFDRISA